MNNAKSIAPIANPGPDRITPDEFRAFVRTVVEHYDTLHAEIADLRDRLVTAAAPLPAPPAGSEVHRDFEASLILLTYNDDGTPAYKIKGGPYLKFGVRVWPEILPLLRIDPASLKPGPNPIHIKVRALLGENGMPRKVVGPAIVGPA